MEKEASYCRRFCLGVRLRFLSRGPKEIYWKDLVKGGKAVRGDFDYCERFEAEELEELLNK